MNIRERKDVADIMLRLTRCDAAESMFLARELETIRAGLFEVEYEQFKFRDLLPINRDMHNGDELFTYLVFDKTGEAKYVSDYGTDFPPVDGFFTEASERVRSVGASYSYSIQELRAAMKAGRPLAQLKANMAREAVERVFDLGALVGDTTMNLTGLFTFTGTETYTVPAGAGGTVWEDKTPDEILADVHAMERQVWVNSLEIEQVNTLALPTSSFAYISTTKVGDGSGADTIKQHLLKNAMHIKQILSSPKLESHATAWTGKRACAYNKSADKLELLIPQEFEQFAPQRQAMALTTNVHGRIGGVALYKPKSVIYGDGI